MDVELTQGEGKEKDWGMKFSIKKYVIFAVILMITGCSHKKEIPSLEEAGTMQGRCRRKN